MWPERDVSVETTINTVYFKDSRIPLFSRYIKREKEHGLIPKNEAEHLEQKRGYRDKTE